MSLPACDMETFEDLNGCMNGDVIDLDKYSEKILDTPPLRRRFATNPELVCEHINEYINLGEKYGIDIYHVLPWANAEPLSRYVEIIELMKNHGAKKFLSYNTNHMVYNLPELHTLLSIGDKKKEDITLSKYYRLLSYEEGGSTSHVLSYWKG